MEHFVGEVEVNECVVDAGLWGVRKASGQTRTMRIARCVDRAACRRTLDERRVAWPVVTELSEPGGDPWAAFDGPAKTDDWEAF